MYLPVGHFAKLVLTARHLFTEGILIERYLGGLVKQFIHYLIINSCWQLLISVINILYIFVVYSLSSIAVQS